MTYHFHTRGMDTDELRAYDLRLNSPLAEQAAQPVSRGTGALMNMLRQQGRG